MRERESGGRAQFLHENGAAPSPRTFKCLGSDQLVARRRPRAELEACRKMFLVAGFCQTTCNVLSTVPRRVESERPLPPAICPQATPISAARQPKRARKGSNTPRPTPAARGSKATRRFKARTFKCSPRHDAYPHRKHDQGGASPGSADQGGPRRREDDGDGAPGSRTSGNGHTAGAAQPLGPPPRRRNPGVATGRPRRRRRQRTEGDVLG